MFVQKPEQPQGIGDVLDDVGKKHGVEAAIVPRFEPALEGSLEDFVRRRSGETRASAFGSMPTIVASGASRRISRAFAPAPDPMSRPWARDAQ